MRVVFFFITVIFLFLQAEAKEKLVGIPLDCELCQFVVQTANILAKANHSQEEILQYFFEWCVRARFTDLDQDVCRGLIVNTYGPELLPILINSFVAPEYVCDLIGLCQNGTINQHLNPKAPADPKKLAAKIVVQNKRDVKTKERESQPRSQSREIKKQPGVYYMLQLADPHVDLAYKMNGIVDCGEPLCNFNTFIFDRNFLKKKTFFRLQRLREEQWDHKGKVLGKLQMRPSSL